MSIHVAKSLAFLIMCLEKFLEIESLILLWHAYLQGFLL